MITIDKVPSEHQEQVAFVAWFRARFPYVLIFAIPNGGARSKAAGGRLKAEGTVKGIPDLFVPSWGLWIEMKRLKGGSVSADQKEIMEYLTSSGYRVIVCKGAEDAIQQVLTAFNAKIV